MMIIVDINENATNPKVVKSLELHFSKIILANLQAGDVNIPLNDGSVLAIERKTPNDFLSSIADGRIFEQVERMAFNAKYSAFIVTGTFIYKEKSDDVFILDTDKLAIVKSLTRKMFDFLRDKKFVAAKEVSEQIDLLNEEIERKGKTNWKGSSVRAAIRVIQYSGCAIEFCPPRRYCDMIAEVYNTVNKSDERQSVRKKRIITFPPVDERVEFIAQMPNVGLKYADALLQFAGMMDNNADDNGYGNIASALHWLTILGQIDKKSRPRGWGPEKILSLRKFMGLQSNQYLKIESET